ncbi:MAG: EF-hand domain-containing protein [Proteobacteria bacterium]|nr:EF-hand domain-containing protein [Pseudomonadota bacterium]
MNIIDKWHRVNHLTFIVFITFFVCTLMGPAIAQEKPAAEKSSTKNSLKTSKFIIKAKSKGDFIGTVTKVNVASKTITVRNKGIIVTFDVINPVFKGYKSLEQIRVGDKIAISYTGDGARITKGTDIALRQETIRPQPEPVKQKYKPAGTNKGRPVRVIERTNSLHFRDVDNNSDGRITPVELSAVVPNLTVEDFKKYDRNGDGYLNESEYNAINRSVSRAHSR